MKPTLLFTVACPCGWTYGPGLKTDVEFQTRRHKRGCEVWAA